MPAEEWWLQGQPCSPSKVTGNGGREVGVAEEHRWSGRSCREFGLLGLFCELFCASYEMAGQVWLREEAEERQESKACCPPGSWRRAAPTSAGPSREAGGSGGRSGGGWVAEAVASVGFPHERQGRAGELLRVGLLG